MAATKKWAGMLALVLIASMLLSACGAPATPEVIEREVVVEKVVKETVVIETEKIVEVEKEKVVEVEKEVTKVVEVEKVITATPVPSDDLPVLRINVTTFPETLDPQQLSWVQEIGHAGLIYEGLTRFAADGSVEPAAAESWMPNEDATVWTFTLREGLTYSDGSPLNAMRYKYSILRNIDPDVPGEYAYLTDDIIGAYDYRASDIASLSDDEIQSLRDAVAIEALDSAGNACTGYDQVDCRTLRIGVRQPAPYFPSVMALWVTYPAREELITRGGPDWFYGATFQVGNGPYILRTLEPFVRAYLEPNPAYWRGDATYAIEYRYITDGSVAFEAYKNGEFDIIQIQAEDLPTIEADSALNAEKQMYAAAVTYALNFHMTREPFSDPKVRQAFALSLDREAWVRDVMKGLGIPTLTWMPPGVPGHRADETRWGFDPEAARQALAESSYGGVENLPEIVANFRDEPRQRTRWEWLAAQWREHLGVEIVLEPVEATTFTALTRDIATHPLLSIYGWGQDYPDPKSWLSDYWRTGTQVDDRGFSNPDIDALVDAADGELDPAKRLAMYEEAEDLLINDCPAAFMYNKVNAFLVKPWVQGYVPSSVDYWWIGDNDPLTVSIDVNAMP
jgi:oligopeptide transport system substrate-binding protein